VHKGIDHAATVIGIIQITVAEGFQEILKMFACDDGTT